jgi:adenylate cyclase
MHLTPRHLRLASGLVLLTYISLHLTNHALALWSLDLAEYGLTWSIALWQSPPGTLALYGAAGVHFALACRTVYTRRHWNLPIVEWVRLWAGFSLPLLLIGHVVTTRLAVSLYGAEPNYRTIVTTLVRSGAQGWQLALLAPGWVHGCLGLWLSLQRFAAMRRAKPLLIGIIMLVPVLSALGFLEMDRAVSIAGVAIVAPPRPDLTYWRHGTLTGYIALIAGAFLAGRLRDQVLRRRLHG